MRMEPAMNGIEAHIKEAPSGSSPALSPCEVIAKKRLSVNQEAVCNQTPNLLLPKS